MLFDKSETQTEHSSGLILHMLSIKVEAQLMNVALDDLLLLLESRTVSKRTFVPNVALIYSVTGVWNEQACLHFDEGD